MNPVPSLPTSITVPNWIIWVGIIAFTLAAIRGIWVAIAKTAHFIHTTVAKIDAILDVIPTILAMGQEFHRNGGSSLRDELDEIRTTAKTATDMSNHNARIAADLAAQTARLTTELHDHTTRTAQEFAKQTLELMADNRRVLDEFRERAEASAHVGLGMLTNITGHIDTDSDPPPPVVIVPREEAPKP